MRNSVRMLGGESIDVVLPIRFEGNFCGVIPDSGYRESFCLAPFL